MKPGTHTVRQVTGDVIGTGLDGAGNIVGKSVTINGSVIQLINPSSEALTALRKVNAIATAVESGVGWRVDGGFRDCWAVRTPVL